MSHPVKDTIAALRAAQKTQDLAENRALAADQAFTDSKAVALNSGLGRPFRPVQAPQAVLYNRKDGSQSVFVPDMTDDGYAELPRFEDVTVDDSDDEPHASSTATYNPGSGAVACRASAFRGGPPGSGGRPAFCLQAGSSTIMFGGPGRLRSSSSTTSPPGPRSRPAGLPALRALVPAAAGARTFDKVIAVSRSTHPHLCRTTRLPFNRRLMPLSLPCF